MPTKASDGTGGCRVLFRMRSLDGVDRASLAGEFNDWSTEATSLEPQPDGSLAVSVVLEPGRSYRYRFYLGDDRWENDWRADDYVDNDHGGGRRLGSRGARPRRPPRQRTHTRLSDRCGRAPRIPTSGPTAVQMAPCERSCVSSLTIVTLGLPGPLARRPNLDGRPLVHEEGCAHGEAAVSARILEIATLADELLDTSGKGQLGGETSPLT
jgi:hypothetical protein